MLLIWRIQYLDRRNKQIDTRDLFLETNDLDPATRASFELCNDLRKAGNDRIVLRYRHLFKERNLFSSQLNEAAKRHVGRETFFLPDYCEDENGNELTKKEIAVIWTGDPSAVLFPGGTPRHFMEYVMSDRRSISVEDVTLSKDQIFTLAYFVRDLRELLDSSFYKEGAGTLKSINSKDPFLQTAVSDEEIRSFITIFRRLYMAKEPSNFLKAIAVYENIAQGNSLVKWIKGSRIAYETILKKPPDLASFSGGSEIPFTRKKLIDVFLYTRYAHQPNPQIERQYKKYLNSVDDKKALLMWHFLGVVHECSMHMHNAGIVVVDFFNSYCKQHRNEPNILNSVSLEHPGIGALEKKQARIDRLIEEKAQELSLSIWIQNGKPSGGSEQYFTEAREQLRAAL